jgi:hypothetical protein
MLHRSVSSQAGKINYQLCHKDALFMHIGSSEEINQENLKHNPPSVPAAGTPGGKAHILVLLLLSGLVFFSSAYISDQLDSPTGDEPHYLVISQTLLLYHSLDGTLDYTHGDYKAFYPGPLGPFQHTSPNKWGKRLPLHSIGAPILWLIPFAIAGRLGTLLFMSLVSLFISLNVYLLLVSCGILRNYAFLTSLGIALASPIWVFSHHNFVEPIAALLCIYMIRVLFQEHLRALDVLGSSVALGVFPWIHMRFALFALVFCCFLLARVYQEDRCNKIKTYLYAFLPMFGLFLLFEAYNFFVWGSLNPMVNQANSGELPFDVAPWRGLLGLFLDQEYGLLTNFPIFLFLLGGITLALKKRFLRFNVLLLLLSVPYIVTIASFHNWDGAISPPARFLTVLVPPLAFYLALALQRARSWVMNGLFLLFMGVSCLYEGVSLSIPGGWMNWEEGHSRPLLRIEQALHLPLTQGVPSVFLPKQALPMAGWFTLLGGLTLVVVLLAQSQAQLAGPLQPSN